MTANCLLPGSPTLGWYLGVIGPYVVRGEGALDWLIIMFSTMHVRTLVEECTHRRTLTANMKEETHLSYMRYKVHRTNTLKNALHKMF
jgi:hypothetical protein